MAKQLLPGAKHAASSLELWYSVQSLSIFKLTLCFQTLGTYTVKFYDGVVQTVKNIHVKAFSKDQVSSVFMLLGYSKIDGLTC